MTKKISDHDFEKTIDDLNTYEWMFGQACGWEDAAKFLKAQSGEMFACGRDQDANMYRYISNLLLREAEKIRSRAQELMAAKDAAITILEELNGE